jgi:hypothetical protein
MFFQIQPKLEAKQNNNNKKLIKNSAGYTGHQVTHAYNLATWQAKIGSIAVQSQPEQIV